MSEYENKKTILVVDDENILVDILKVHFKNNYKVLTAYNGKDAFEIYKINRIDVVLTDVDIPIMNGLKLLDEIKKINPLAKVYVMSAENYKIALERGASGFLQKPFSLENLDKIIKN